jgi:hypothetical protein
MNAGASTYAVPSPIKGSGTAWVLLGSWALSPARPTPIHPRHECRGLSALFGELGSTDQIGNNGAFLIPYQSCTLRVIASDGQGWGHVSVSLPNRTPNWREMCFIKDLLRDAEDVGIQYHPAKSEYVNLHDNCLHL